MSRKNSSPSRRLATLGAATLVLLATVAAILTVSGWRPQAEEVNEAAEELTPQEIADVKAAVEKQTGMPVRYVGRNRQGVVEVFAGGGPHRGRAAYRVKKTDEGWKVVGSFLAFSA